MVGGIGGLNPVQGRFELTSRNQRSAMQRISSGKRINSAADDAANLATVQQFLAMEAGTAQGVQNLADGQSMVRTAEGSLAGSSDLISRMRELAIQGRNGTLSDADRATIQQEYDQLAAEVTRISNSTGFNGNNLLDGSVQGAGAVQLADGQGGSVSIEIEGQSAQALGIEGLDISDASTLTALDGAIDSVSSARAKLGAVDNTLDHRMEALRVTNENTAAARSRIGDADFAVETSRLTRANILEQSQLALQVHSRNLESRSILSLLG